MHLRNTVHQEETALVWKKLTVKHEAEAGIISDFLGSVIRPFDQKVVNNLSIILDGLECRGFLMVEMVAVRLTPSHLLLTPVINSCLQDHLEVLGHSQTQEIVLGINKCCQVRDNILNRRTGLDDLLHRLVTEILH